MRRVRRVWRRVVTEARWLRDRYWASELDPYFQGPDEDEHSVRVDPAEARRAADRRRERGTS